MGGTVGFGGVLPPPPPISPTTPVSVDTPGLTAPARISSQEPAYTQEAIDAKVEGVIVLRCVITVAGSVTGCKVIKSLPFLENAALEAVQKWRFKPGVYKGAPQAVNWVFVLRFKLPAAPAKRP